MEGSGTQGFLGCPGSASRPGALSSPGLVPTSQVTALKCAVVAAPAETGKLVPAAIAIAGCEGLASPTDLHFLAGPGPGDFLW